MIVDIYICVYIIYIVDISDIFQQQILIHPYSKSWVSKFPTSKPLQEFHGAPHLQLHLRRCCHLAAEAGRRLLWYRHLMPKRLQNLMPKQVIQPILETNGFRPVQTIVEHLRQSKNHEAKTIGFNHQSKSTWLHRTKKNRYPIGKLT